MSRPASIRLFRVASGIALGAFHATLLWGRFADASILDPAVLLRWAGAFALLGAAMAVQRFAPRRFRGARALLVFSLLAALLHVGVPLDAVDADLALALLIPPIAIVALAAAGRPEEPAAVLARARTAFVPAFAPGPRSDPRAPPHR